MDPLTDFLRRSAGLPFVWGQRDCVLWASEWVSLRRGLALGQRFRGRYASAIGCARLLQAEGGMLALIERECAAVGIAAIGGAEARPGDVVAVHSAGLFPMALGIRTARHIAFKCPGLGVSMIDAAPLKAWRI